jgi:hypothetical protein
MDEFMECGMKHIGVGGLKCPCCNSYRTFGNHKKRSKKFSRLRRAIMKRKLDKIRKMYC